LCGSAERVDVGPDLKGLGPGSPVLIGGDVMAAEMEEVVDRVVRREEPLCLSWRFEPPHLSLASSRRLMRILSCCYAPCAGDA
jgi:hypothetical protein